MGRPTRGARRVVRHAIERYGGREIATAGDGFLSTFDRPTRGVRCAQTVIGLVRGLGLEVRAGLHTGEIETTAEGLSGIALHIAARIAALAGPGRALVSGTVGDLVAGSGIEFEDRGPHPLKGVPGEWRLFEVKT